MSLYKLTPEHEVMLPSWRDRWIANAMSIAAMTDDDRAACTEAVYGLYEAAGLKRPRVVFVPSPFVGAFATGFAAAIWQVRKNGVPATRAATDAATDAAAPHGGYDLDAGIYEFRISREFDPFSEQARRVAD